MAVRGGFENQTTAADNERVTGAARRLAALAATTAVLAGCGGAGGSGGASSSPAAGARSSPAAPYLIAPAPYSLDLPASSHGPTTCTVYAPGYATQIVVNSRSLDVRAECAVWAANRPGYGYLWGYEQPVATPDATELCALKDPRRDLRMSVIEETGLVPVTAAQRATGLSACARISAAGWRRVPLPRRSGGLKILLSPRPTKRTA
jgi:hypothetical protein